MSDARESLVRNLQELMAANPDLKDQAKLARKAGVSVGLINGLFNDEPGEASEPRVDIVEKLASAFGYAAWQLLHPSLKVAEREQKLYATFRSLMDEERGSSAG